MPDQGSSSRKISPDKRREYREKQRTVSRICEQCSATFFATPSDVKQGWAKYCSKRCLHDSMRVDKSSKEWQEEHKRKVRECKKKQKEANAAHWKEAEKRWNRTKYKKLKPDAKTKEDVALQVLKDREARASRVEKQCSKCGITKPLEEFRKAKTSADGRNGICALCTRKRIVVWRDGRRDKEREREKERYRKNPERHREATRKYREAHHEELRVAQNARNKEKYAKDPTKFIESNNKRRVAKAEIPGSHTVNEWKALCNKFKNRCVCCGKHAPLTMDHVIPITKPGSSDYIENIQPLCRNCNSKKLNSAAIDYRKTPFRNLGQIVLFT